MSLQEVRIKLETALDDIYEALEEKSVTIPKQKNLVNVAPAIRSIRPVIFNPFNNKSNLNIIIQPITK